MKDFLENLTKIVLLIIINRFIYAVDLMSKLEQLKEILNEIKDIWNNWEKLIAVVNSKTEIEDDFLNGVIQLLEINIKSVQNQAIKNKLEIQKQRIKALKDKEIQEREQELHDLEKLLNI